MQAAQVLTLEGPQAVRVGEVADPRPGPGQVLVEVHAAGLCFPDLLLTRGEYQLRPDPPFVIGSEVAGVVRSAPEGSGLAPGDRVAAFPGLSGLAELVAVDRPHVFPLPEQVPFPVGAGLPMNYLTADFALRRRGRLTPGETVLVHGAAGGVGTAAVQVARALGGEVIAVTSSPERAELARATGARWTVPAEGFREAVRELTAGRGVDLVLDPVGGDRFTDSLRSLAPLGRLLVVGFTAGQIPTVKVNRLLLNNIDVVGVGWGAFPEPGMAAAQWEHLLPHIRSGALRPPSTGRHTLSQVPQLLAQLADRRLVGKAVVTLRD